MIQCVLCPGGATQHRAEPPIDSAAPTPLAARTAQDFDAALAYHPGSVKTLFHKGQVLLSLNRTAVSFLAPAVPTPPPSQQRCLP